MRYKIFAMKKLKYLFPALTLLLLTTSCWEDADDNGNILPSKSAYDRIAESEDHTTLKAALDLTGLDVTLRNNGSFTVFAPTNAAFAQYLTDNALADLNAIPLAELRNLLLYHVLQRINRTGDFLTGYAKTSASNLNQENLDLYIQTTPAFLMNNSVSITTADINANNGIVHITDNVLTLPTLATLVTANPSFSNLTAALIQESLDTALENTITTGALPAPFSVFAPTDAAFQALIDENTTDSLNSIADVLALPNLSDVLLYHVVSGSSLRVEDFTDGFVIDPITTGTFTINTTGGIIITDAGGRLINLLELDITAINGVLHSVDNVLFP